MNSDIQTPIVRTPADVTEDDFHLYWVLYIDLAGFSSDVFNQSKRLKIASFYQSIVDGFLTDRFPTDFANAAFPQESDKRNLFIQDWASRVQVFSDSIFIFFETKNEVTMPMGSIGMLPVMARAISSLLWILGIPHKGAVSLGKCYINAKKHVFLGEPIVRAYNWEKASKAFVISVEPSSKEFVFRTPSILDKTLYYPLPTSNGAVFSRCLTMPFDEMAKVEMIVDGFTQAFEDAHRTSYESLPKYLETARFFKACGCKDERILATLGEEPISQNRR